MLRLLFAAALLFALPAAAQDFPAAGTGAFSWTVLGGQRVEGEEIVFAADGTPLALEGSNGQRYQNGSWTAFDWPSQVGSMGAALPLGGDTLIVSARAARTTDGGETWEYPCGTGGDITCDRAYENSSHNIDEITVGPYAGRLLAGGALYSDDRGASWTTAEVNANETNWLFRMRAFAPLPSGRVVGAGEWGVGISPDGGESWAPGSVFSPYQTRGSATKPWATPGSIQAHEAGGPVPDCGLPVTECEGAVVIASDGSEHLRAYWTNDGGHTWAQGGHLQQVYDTPGWSTVAFMRELDRAGAASSGGGLGLGRGLVVVASGFVLRTADGGVTWEVIARAPSIGSAPEDGGIMLSAELGPDGRLYTVQTQGGEDEYVWVTEEPASSALDFVVADEATPSASDLAVTVAPNPSRGGMVTARVVQASPAADLRVEVWDAVGRRVAVLHEGAAVGALALDVDTSGFAAGVYHVVVTSGGERVSTAFTVAR